MLLIGRFTLILAVSFSLGPWAGKFQRDTSSRAATERGLAAYQKNDPKAAVPEFRTAQEINPAAMSSFNTATALIAAGKKDEGVLEMAPAIEDPKTSADAYYNRGNAWLGAKQFKEAASDYIEALKIRPSDQQAKRNLELALRELLKEHQSGKSGGGAKQEAESSGGGKNEKPGPGEKEQKPEQTPAGEPPGDPGGKSKSDQKGKFANLVLKAVQQQEGEELRRMKKGRGQNEKVGW